MKAGELRHRITIRRQANTPDGKGGFTRAWTNVLVNAPAKIESQNGREGLIDRVLQGINTFKITIRWVTGILPADQILWDDGPELNIQSATDPDGQRDRIEIIASTQAPQGA